MLLRQAFKKIKPQITDPKWGSEPTLYDMIYSYYIQHMDEDKAKDSTEQYIEGWMAKFVTEKNN